ncbi:hypothetical protein SAMN04488541_10384 [Thermoflexibacter ruber]|uniref:Uncharacterized protein n=1 Tax=Thermoflexibacter ruber TaxID=1003 RepID=A0A1I2IYB7_9BACT|nr:hypothetical protein SAMN04488541_10384 [Thermoflexibacter ruber]
MIRLVFISLMFISLIFSINFFYSLIFKNSPSSIDWLLFLLSAMYYGFYFLFMAFNKKKFDELILNKRDK